MSKTVHLFVSEEAYECALWLARLARKDSVWVMSQWLHFAKDEAVQQNVGLKAYIESWRVEKLKDYQMSLIEPEHDNPDDLAF